MKVIPSGQTLGATIEGLNLSQPLSDEAFEFAMRALGEHGVLRFPGQDLTARQLRDFSARFGELEINVANSYQEPGIPEVMILSNIVENGKPIGLADAGQSWHTDMSYSRSDRVLQRALRHQDPAPQRPAARQHRVLRPARGLRRACRPTSSARSKARPCCTTSTSSGR